MELSQTSMERNRKLSQKINVQDSQSFGEEEAQPVYARGFHLWLCQFTALVLKNFEVLYRRPLQLMLQLLAPTVSVLIVLLIAIASADVNKTGVNILTPQKCEIKGVSGQSSCTQVAFQPNIEPYISIMRRVAKDGGWEMDKDVRGFANKQQINKFMFADGAMGVLDAAVSFDQSGTVVSYTLTVNATYDLMHYAGLQLSIEKAIMSFYTNTTADVSVTTSPFTDISPGTIAEFQEFSTMVVANSAMALVLLSALLLLMTQVSMVTREKKEGLLVHMRMMGLMEGAYWSSWFVTFSTISLFSSLIFACGTQATGIQLFTARAFGIWFLFHFCFCISISGFSLFLASFLKQPRWVGLVIFFVIMGWSLLVLTFAIAESGEVKLYTEMYQPNVKTFFKFILFTQPWFHYGKVFVDFQSVTDQKEMGPYGKQAAYYSPSVSYSLGCMVGVGVLYLWLAWYFAQLFGGEYSRRFFFPLTPSYWGYGKVNEAVFAGDTIAETRKASLIHQDVRLHKLSKSYKSATAVKELTLTMKRGEIFCMLGQNGAGKTTTIHCLTGLHNCTHGDAFIHGKSITHQMTEIQSLMGMCPQHDILFAELSGRSHLNFWSRFKGVLSKNITQQVDKVLEEVSLMGDATAPAGTYSGGMKRRLSIGMAAVGNSRVIFLDEPTTGLDPLSRQRVWRMIERLKKGRVVCLTTHSMEEADALGNEIAILEHGRLRAIGSSLFLKNRFGKGYQVTLMTKSEEAAAQLISIVQDMIPGANVLSNAAGYVTVGIPKNNFMFIPNFFKFIENDTTELVNEWGISNTTLEEVFLRLVGQSKTNSADGVSGDEDLQETHDDQMGGIRLKYLDEPIESQADGITTTWQEVVLISNNVSLPVSKRLYTMKQTNETSKTDEEKAILTYQTTETTETTELKATNQSGETSLIDGLGGLGGLGGFGKSSGMVQIRALLIKSISFQRHQKKTNICYIFFLILLVALAMIFGLLFNFDDQIFSNETTFCTEKKQNECVCQGSYASWKRVTGSANLYKLCTEDGFVKFVDRMPCKYPCDLQSTDCVEADENGTTDKKGKTDICTYKTLWESSTSGCSSSHNKPTPTTRMWVDEGQVARSFFTYNFTGLGNGIFGQLKVKNVHELSFSSVDEAVQASQQTVLDNSRLTSLCGYCGWRVRSKYAYVVGDGQVYDTYERLFPDFGISVSKSDPERLKLHYTLYTYSNLYPLAAVVSNTGNCTNVIARDLSQVNTIISGMTRGLLNTANHPQLSAINARIEQMPNPRFDPEYQLNHNLVLAMLTLPMATMLTLPVLVRILVHEKETKVFVMMRMQGLNLRYYWLSTWIWNMCVSLVFTGFFVGLNYAADVKVYKQCNAAGMIVTNIVWGHAISSFSLVLAAFITKESFALLASTLLVLLQTALGAILVVALPVSQWPGILLAFPQGSYSRAVVLSFSNLQDSTDMWASIGLLFLEATVLLFLAIWVHNRKNIGSSDSSFWGCCKAKNSSTDLENDTQEDIDIANERQLVQNGGLKNSAIRIHGLGKTYPSRRGRAPKQAVKSLFLSIKNGEVFGLLGPNGAGKTTTLHMLSGHIAPSRGEVSVCGYDVVTELEKVHGILGMCPQFDWHWEDLTVEDHLLLYVRLKGAHQHAERGLVQRIAKSVNLDGDALKTPSKSLSGGMRRRLSLGIALCGDPKVVFLDEPTTGLDPETRQDVWKIIDNAKRDRGVVLTTHSMEEADALCERIGIIADGSLQCLGSQLHLKNRYGKGYKLTVNFNSSNLNSDQVRNVDDFVKSLAPMVEVVVNTQASDTVASTRSYTLAKKGISVSNIFKRMEEERQNYGIREWGITMTSLDEVFMHIAKEAEKSNGK